MSHPPEAEQHFILRKRFSLTKGQGGTWSSRMGVPGEDALSWGEDPAVMSEAPSLCTPGRLLGAQKQHCSPGSELRGRHVPGRSRHSVNVG